MSTYREIITKSLRLIHVTSGGETPNADEMSDGLETFNDMLTGLKADGVDLGIGRLGLDDDFPLAPEFERSIKYLLAVDLAPEYSFDVQPEVSVNAAAGLAALRTAFVRVETLRMDNGLRRRTNQHSGGETLDGT